MKYNVRVIFEGCLEKVVEADSEEEAEELANDFWDDASACEIADNAMIAEIETEEKR